MPNDLLQTFRSRLPPAADTAGSLRADIEAAVLARRDVRSGHADWGLLCEEAGLLPLAFREFQLALRDEPNHPVAAFRLAQHYREQGDTGRSADLLERLLLTEPAREDWLSLYVGVLRDEDAQPKIRQVLDRAVKHGLAPEKANTLARTAAPEEAGQPADDEEAELAPSDADCVRFQSLFAGREDTHARQWATPKGEGGYSPINEPLTVAVVRNHLLGTYTVGVYPIRLDNTCNFFAIDLDIDKASLEKAQGQPDLARSLRSAVREEVLRLRGMLRDLGFIPVLEDSGFKGRHLWVFLEQPEPAEVLHVFGRLLLAWQTPLVPAGLHLEFFPKQASRKGKGLGNLIKLPLGIHRRTGRRAVLLDGTGKPLPEPLAALRKVVRASQAVLHAALDKLKVVSRDAESSERSAAPRDAESAEPTAPKPPAGPPPPLPMAAWTEADFDADPRLRHLLKQCPVLGELKRTVDDHRQLSHEEQLVLIHTMGHVEGGPQAVNYLLGKCLDVGPEKLMKDRLKGNPTSCASIRKRIGHITRRVPCNCPFDFAPDRYPTPVLHLLTLEETVPAPAPAAADAETLARRYAAILVRREEVEKEYEELRKALVGMLRGMPERALACPGGRYVLVEEEGVEELRWEKEVTSEK